MAHGVWGVGVITNDTASSLQLQGCLQSERSDYLCRVVEKPTTVLCNFDGNAVGIFGLFLAKFLEN